MTDRAQLLRRVGELTADKPYVVTPTRSGFDVELDLGDVRWHSALHQAELSNSLTHHVAVDDDRHLVRITDETRSVSWRAGVDGPVPYVAAGASGFKGRVAGGGTRKTYAWRNGHFEKESTSSYDLGEGRELVRTAARELGYDERMGGAQGVGVVFAVIGVAAAVLTILALGIGFLSQM